ncbi:MAG: biopolymer transport protein ExbB [Rhodothermales bacterium]|jgi:biopolymer transport protein ExbB
MIGHILDGGYIMLPLLLLSVGCFAIIFERLCALKSAGEVDTLSLRETVIAKLGDGDIDGAIRYCEAQQGPVAALLLVGLAKFRRLLNRGKTMVEIEVSVNKAMEDYAPHIVNSLEKRLNILAMIAAVAPLLGMTGTVTGMIASFSTMASGLDAGLVSVGISEALVTTAAGLIVAIPAVIAYNLFNKRIEKMVLEMEEHSTELLDKMILDFVVE